MIKNKYYLMDTKFRYHYSGVTAPLCFAVSPQGILHKA